MRISIALFGAVCLSVWLAGCSGGGSSTTAPNTSTAEGTLIYNPPLRVAHLTASDLKAMLASDPSGQGQQLLQLAGGVIQCGVDVHHIQYTTVGAAGEATTASGALMVPNGSGTDCSGARPIVLYAHGTSTDKDYDIANVVDASNAGYGEAVMLATLFAAQGYIVVAPNYAGYDTSTLPYHPYLDANQQSKDMLDALSAARSALGHISASATDDGKLFVTGYSEGGYVAMATQRALQDRGTPPTASAPMSGPYAMEAFGDAIVSGNVDLGSTVFIPMLTTSYQHAYDNVYSTPGDFYSATYATGIDTLLPSTSSLTALFTSGKLPQTAMFDNSPPATGNPTLDATLAVPSNPLFAIGFGNPYLVNDSTRIAYLTDASLDPDGASSPGAPLAVNPPSYPFRDDLYVNDMRYGGFMPVSPTLLCGGSLDPTVFYDANTEVMVSFWSAEVAAGLVIPLDMQTDTSSPFSALSAAFQTTEQSAGGMPAIAAEYHSMLAPFCTAAARSFFDNF